MSVVEKNGVREARVGDHEPMASGRPTSTDVPVDASRTTEDYRAIWRQIYDDARRSGSTDSGARFLANERLVIIESADRGVEPVGTGNYLAYS